MKTTLELIERLDRWLARHRPRFHARLRPGLTEDQMADFERFVGHPFPEGFRAFYRWRNGQPGHFEPREEPGQSFVRNQYFMSEAEVRHTWEEMTSMLEGGEWEEPQWWCRGWIPFLHNDAGSHLCLDLEGSFTGHKGQVIEFWNKDMDRPIVAPSFDAWLEHFVASLEAGLWHESPDGGDFNEVGAIAPLPGYPIRGDARKKSKRAKKTEK